MSGIWFVGDLHFGHEKVANLRGFKTCTDHDVDLINKWNKVVKQDDIVYVLGDISSGTRETELKALTFLSYMPGRKRLIAGNHDSISGIHRQLSPNIKSFRKVFETIQDYGRIRIDHESILLSHYPYVESGDGPGRGPARYKEFRLPDTGSRLIHAHTHHHEAFSNPNRREMCVSWDAWNRMVSIGDVDRWVRVPIE